MSDSRQVSFDWLADASVTRTVTHPPRARRGDPETSHAAAARAATFARGHEEKILNWLRANPASTYREIASGTGMEAVAVGRRLKGLRDRQAIRPVGERDGCQTWSAA